MFVILGHQLAHHFNQAFEIKAFARMHVQLKGNGIKLFLAVYGQIRSLRQILPDQIDILIGISLPRTMQVTRSRSRRQNAV